MPQPLEFEQVGYNSPDGVQIGRTSTEAVGFYGVTPVARPVTVSTSDVSTTTTVSAGGAVTTWAFLNQADINNLVTAVSTMQRAMKQMGILP